MPLEGPVWAFDDAEKRLLRNLAVSYGVKLPDSLFEQNSLAPSDVDLVEKSFPKSSPIFPFLLALRPQLLIPNPARSAEHVALTARLRAENACRSINPPTWARRNQPLSFGAELRAANRQLTSIINMVLTVVAAFVFGFYGLSLAYPSLSGDMTLRAVLGLVFATVVFIADIYFVIKNMTLDDPQESTRPQ